ncbi:MAG: DEAD/DEAH box helicase, partial [Clostridia bacterium]|nr:DEAD/DEAH box helicase [Clostridia bacterium]
MGGPDEQLQGSSGRGDSAGADLRLTDYEPQAEQLSFIFPAEPEQIQIIDRMETEGIGTVPSAFMFSQADIDAELRRGSGMQGGKMRIYALYQHQPDAKAAIDFLKKEYGISGHSHTFLDGSYGFADYSAKGLRLYHSDTKTETNIKWNVLEKRLRMIVTEGSYLTVAEKAAYADAERNYAGTAVGVPMPIARYGFPPPSAEVPVQTAPEWGYNAVKEAHPDDMVLYQVDDCFALYGEDARIAASMLGLALTSRSVPGVGRVDMCGIPIHQLEQYVEQLRDKYDVTISAVDRDSKERRVSSIPSIDHEAALAIDAYEAEFGADGTRVFGSSTIWQEEDTPAPRRTEITQADIDAAIQEWNGDVASKRAVVRRLREGASREELLHVLREEYGDDLPAFPVNGASGAADIPWDEIRGRVLELIEEDRFFTEEEQDAWKDIDTSYIRKRLEEAGVVNGEVIDQEKLAQSPFIQQVEQTVAQITQEEEQSRDIMEATYPELSQPLPDLTEQPVAQASAYQVGDTVFLEDGKPFIVEKIGPLGIELRDPSQVYPILRAESSESFARLIERYPQEQPEVVSETTTVYPAEQNSLPYDLVVEKMSMTPRQEHPEQPAAQNFRISDTHLGEGGSKTKYGYNIAAIRTLKQIEAEGRMATPDEQKVLSRYVGWGSIPNAFDDSKADWKKEYEELKALLTPEEYAMARASTLNAHYTSPTVIRAIYDAVENMGFRTGNILEPSCGVGNFFGLLPDSMRGSRLYGVELDSITGRIARQLYPEADITISGFEKTNRQEFFDLAVGNVPFGSYKLNDRKFNAHNFLIHDYFFAKALDQVRAGGVIAFITSKGTMDKQSPEVRRYIAERAELLGAIRLPNHAFRANAGTEVTSDILFLQKRDRPIVQDEPWVHLGQTDDGIPINTYFVEHPDMVLGRMAWDQRMYGNEKETTCEPIEGADLSQQLAVAVKNIQGKYREAELPDLADSGDVVETIPADPTVKNYSYTVVNGQVYFRQESIMVRQELNQVAQERIKGLVGL